MLSIRVLVLLVILVGILIVGKIKLESRISTKLLTTVLESWCNKFILKSPRRTTSFFSLLILSNNGARNFVLKIEVERPGCL